MGRQKSCLEDNRTSPPKPLTTMREKSDKKQRTRTWGHYFIFSVHGGEVRGEEKAFQFR